MHGGRVTASRAGANGRRFLQNDIKSHLPLQMSGGDCKLSGNMCFLYRTTWAKASPQVFLSCPMPLQHPRDHAKQEISWGFSPQLQRQVVLSYMIVGPEGIWKECISFPSSHSSHPCEESPIQSPQSLTRAKEKGARSPITWVKMVLTASVWQPPGSPQQLQARLSPLAGESESAEAPAPTVSTASQALGRGWKPDLPLFAFGEESRSKGGQMPCSAAGGQQGPYSRQNKGKWVKAIKCSNSSKAECEVERGRFLRSPGQAECCPTPRKPGRGRVAASVIPAGWGLLQRYRKDAPSFEFRAISPVPKGPFQSLPVPP